MKGDFSRLRFDRGKNYTSLLQQQGRVALDSDANEQRAIDEYIRTTETIDVIGKTGGPVSAEGFEITVNSAGDAIEIGRGRYYVEGILCENDRDVLYSHQQFLIGGPNDKTLLSGLKAGNINVVQVYLEVWRRLVTALDDPCLREPALGQADTTARLQTVWRVVLETQPLAGTVTLTKGQAAVMGSGTSFTTDLEEGQQVTFASDTSQTPYVIKSIESDTSLTLTTAYDPAEAPTGSTTVSVLQTGGNCCQSMDSGPMPAPDPGSLNASTATSSDCGCQPVPAAGYLGLENQLYRVEIHQPGDESSATFKWSRENASVVVAVTGVSGNNVTVASLGPDANLGFTSGQWVELYDDSSLFGPEPNQPGNLYQIKLVTASTLTVTMAQASVTAVDPKKNARMRRWDQSGASAGVNGIAVAAGPLALESGIQIEFGKGQYRSGDYWLIPARTATGNIEWPPCGTKGPFQPPLHTGIFRVPLACIQLDSQKNVQVKDCRKKFYPLTDLTPGKKATCCTHTVGDGGNFKSIQEAVDKLPPEGGEVCILPGLYYENVSIVGCRDIVIHGCGWQTRVASKSLNPPSPARDALAPLVVATAPVNAVGAVFRIVDSHHIVLRSLAVEAADDEAGILVDGAGTTLGSDRLSKIVRDAPRGVVDIAIADMTITAAAWPAILADRTELLRIDRNRIAMKDLRSQWTAVYASGREIHIERNHVGIQSLNADNEWLPYSVEQDLSAGITETSASVQHQGGIQIGGASTDVYIVENEIDGGSGNGIMLGGLEVLDTKGANTEIWTGAFTSEGDSCDGGSLLISSIYTAEAGYTVVAGGLLTNIQIHRNRIRNMGLCGIGPVGFFELNKTAEIISTVGLCITENEISNTLLGPIKPFPRSSRFAWGAICIPDVQNLVICDNAITNFGPRSGDDVCGIFVLHGEMVEISRNRVMETRDWTKPVIDENSEVNPPRGGICLGLVTPPALGQTLENIDDLGKNPVFEPGLPAVRVESNVVRVPLSYTLAITGWGPFVIANNQLACGGRVRSSTVQLAQTVAIVNLGTPIEFATAAGGFSGRFAYIASTNDAQAPPPASEGGSCGSVLFTGNVCQLEATVSQQRALASVLILTFDHLIFSNNVCWIDTPRFSVFFDAMLLSGSINAVSNRFQERPFSVAFSGLTAGISNITGQNISTFCLIPLAIFPMPNNTNIASVDPANTGVCPAFWGSVVAAFQALG